MNAIDASSAIDASQIVAQIVADHPSCAKVFTENKIDFCCKGGVTLAEACTERGLDPGEILARVRSAATSETSEPAPVTTTWSTPELIAHIVSRHHAYLRRAFPALEPLVTKVARVHGAHEPKLHGLPEELRELRAALEPHMDEEETELFPMLMSREQDRARVAERLPKTRAEHERVGRSLARIRALCDDFRVPDWACGSYRMMVSDLAELEEDTLRHVHLENHVLMPRFEDARPRRPAVARRRSRA